MFRNEGHIPTSNHFMPGARARSGHTRDSGAFRSGSGEGETHYTAITFLLGLFLSQNRKK